MQQQRFRLTKSLLAVQFGEPQTAFLTLPVGADIYILGPSTIPACVEIDCKHEHYHIFERDLLSNSTTRGTAMAAHA
jgi:hypothetical protein